MDYHKLMDYYRKEMSNAGLVKLPDGFYSELIDLLKEKRALLSDADPLKQREYWNVKKVITRLVEKRIEKIVYAALNGVEVSTTPEELNLYATVKGSIEGFRKMVESEMKRQNDEKKDDAQKKDVKKVRIVKYVEKYVGADSNIYGPYDVGDVVELPNEEADWLIATGYAADS